MGFRHPMGEDPGIATQRHLNETLERHPILTNAEKRLARSVKTTRRLLAQYAEDAHHLRQPRAAQALEGIAEVAGEVQDELEGKR